MLPSEDTGQMPKNIQAALDLWSQNKNDVTRVGLVSALATSRLLVALVEQKDGELPEMVQVNFQSNDGRKALLAFTCIEQLHFFNVHARPLVKDSISLALEALEQNYDGLIIDIASEHRIALTLAEIASIARG